MLVDIVIKLQKKKTKHFENAFVWTKQLLDWIYLETPLELLCIFANFLLSQAGHIQDVSRNQRQKTEHCQFDSCPLMEWGKKQQNYHQKNVFLNSTFFSPMSGRVHSFWSKCSSVNQMETLASILLNYFLSI